MTSLIQDAARIRKEYSGPKNRMNLIALAFVRHLLAIKFVPYTFDRVGIRRVTKLVARELGVSKNDLGNYLTLLREEKAGISRPWVIKLLENGRYRSANTLMKSISQKERGVDKIIWGVKMVVAEARRIRDDGCLVTKGQKALALVVAYQSGHLLDVTKQVTRDIAPLRKIALKHAKINPAEFENSWSLVRAVHTGRIPASKLDDVRNGLVSATTVIQGSEGFGHKSIRRIKRRKRRELVIAAPPVAQDDDVEVSFATTLEGIDDAADEIADLSLVDERDLPRSYDKLMTVVCNALDSIVAAATNAGDATVTELATASREQNGLFKMRAAQLLGRRNQTKTTTRR